MKAKILLSLLVMPSFALGLDQMDKQLMQIANEFNQSMPMDVGNGVVAVNMGYIPGSRIVIASYQFQTATVAEIKQYGIDKIKAQGEKNLVRMNCTSEPNAEYMRNQGIRMKYRYFDKYNNHICDIWVSKEDCLRL